VTVDHRQLANAIRVLSMDAVQAANSGHPGAPMGLADVATVLFTKYLKFHAEYPHWPDRDRFVLSGGHGSMLQYAVMHLCGYSDMLECVDDNGFVHVPEGEGLGVVYDWSYINKNKTQFELFEI